MVLLRDDISGRLRRTAVRFSKSSEEAEGEGTQDVDVEMTSAVAGAADDDMESMDVDNDETPAPDSHPTEGSTSIGSDPDTLAARRLTKTLLDQAHLSPFPLSTRPVHWDYGSALQLYPLPSALVIADAEAPPFALNYMGCCVMNPGRLVDGRRGERVRWVEFDVVAGRGETRLEGS
jgi:DNA polymerase epsilon subunit 2